MRRRILTVGGTDVFLHAGTLLFLGYAWLTGSLLPLAAAMGSILLHECAHAAVAALMGQPPREIELTPMGAVMRLEDEERLPALRRLLMVLAGPAMSLLLCAAAYALTAARIIPVGPGRALFLSNAAILMVNLLPALPLDGGRVLMLALSALLPAGAARTVMRIAGTVTGLSLIVLGAYLAWQTGAVNLTIACAGCFILYSTSSALTTQAMAELRLLMDRKIRLESRGSLPCRIVAVLYTTPLRRCLRLLPPGRMALFAVFRQGTGEMLGVLTEQQLTQAWLEEPSGLCGSVLRGENAPATRALFQGMTKREQATH